MWHAKLPFPKNLKKIEMQLPGFLYCKEPAIEQELSKGISVFEPGILLHEFCAGSLVMLQRLTNMAIRTFTLTSMEKAVQDKDVIGVHFHVHAMKSQFAWFGVHNGERCAFELEMCLKDMMRDRQAKEICVDALRFEAQRMKADLDQLKSNIHDWLQTHPA